LSWASKRDHWRDPAVAASYDERRFRGHSGRIKHARDARLVLALLRELGGVERVLDLPAGTGRLWPELAAAGLAVVGADLSPAMLAAAGERRGTALGLVQAEGERLPLAAGAVDAAVCLRFLFHVDDAAARARILAELARVSRRGVVGEVRWGATAKHAARRLRRHAKLRPAFARDALERELAAAGLALVRVRPVSRVFSDKALFLARPASAC
jgi:ubiquinone/menaquinone biosynthesis C-methylase UbiE